MLAADLEIPVIGDVPVSSSVSLAAFFGRFLRFRRNKHMLLRYETIGLPPDETPKIRTVNRRHTDRVHFIADRVTWFHAVTLLSLALVGWCLWSVARGEFAQIEMGLETSLWRYSRVDLDRENWAESQKYQLVTELALMRETALIESRPHPLPETERRRGAGLIFLTYAGLEVPDIWEWWLDDAYKWIHDEGLEDPSIPPSQSKILRPAIHYFYGFERDYIDKCASPHLKDTAMHVVGEGTWGNLQPNIQIAYDQLLHACPDCYFITQISQNSIPVKRFKDWYNDLIKDARSRMNIVSPVYHFAYPGSKTTIWRTLIRQHAEAVAKYPVDPYLTRHIPRGASQEEYWPAYQISQYVGERAYSQIKCARLFEHSIDHGYVVTSKRACPHSMEHYECWNKNCGGSWDGNYTDPPFAYGRILKKRLDDLLNNKATFFARKFHNETSVVSILKDDSPPDALVMDYVRKKLQLNSSWSHLSSGCELPHPFAKLRNARTKDEIKTTLLSSCLPGLKPEYRNVTCETGSMTIFQRTDRDVQMGA